MSGHLHIAFNGFLTDCPECQEEYIALTAEEANDMDRLCPRCFEEWPGLTMEELINGI